MTDPGNLAERVAPEHLGVSRPFYFLRHGETPFNRERRFQGQSDVPLNDLGVEQAEQAARDLAGEPIKRIVSSPLRRARHTADLVAAVLGVAVEEDPDLMECHLGIYQGRPYEPWLPDYWTGNFAPEGGEDFWQFRARVWPAMQRAVAGGKGTLLVAHGGLWIAARSFVMMEPNVKRLPNALPLYIEPRQADWQVTALAGRPLPVSR